MHGHRGGGHGGGPVAFEAGFPGAGTYTTTAFQPRLTVQIDDAWQVLFQDDEDEMALEGDSGDRMMFLAARVSRVVAPTGGVADAPDDLVAWLRGHPSFTAAAPVATTVDSQPATSIDITNERSTETDIFYFLTASFHIPPGVRLRFTVVPMDGTPRVWPGAVLVEGEVVGTWRRAQTVVTVEPWRAPTAAQRHAIEAEAASMPLPGVRGQVQVRWAAEVGVARREVVAAR